MFFSFHFTSILLVSFPFLQSSHLNSAHSLSPLFVSLLLFSFYSVFPLFCPFPPLLLFSGLFPIPLHFTSFASPSLLSFPPLFLLFCYLPLLYPLVSYIYSLPRHVSLLFFSFFIDIFSLFPFHDSLSSLLISHSFLLLSFHFPLLVTMPLPLDFLI